MIDSKNVIAIHLEGCVKDCGFSLEANDSKRFIVPKHNHVENYTYVSHIKDTSLKYDYEELIILVDFAKRAKKLGYEVALVSPYLQLYEACPASYLLRHLIAGITGKKWLHWSVILTDTLSLNGRPFGQFITSVPEGGWDTITLTRRPERARD